MKRLFSRFSPLSSFLLLWLLMVIAVACIGEKDTEAVVERVQVGSSVPSFEVKQANGEVFQSKSEERSVKLIVFFDTTCRDCQQFLPILQACTETLQQTHHRLNGKQVVVCAIAREQGQEEVQAYWQTHHLSIPFATPGNRNIYHLFANAVIPRVYVVNAEGTITAKFTDRPMATHQQLMTALQEAAQ